MALKTFKEFQAIVKESMESSSNQLDEASVFSKPKGFVQITKDEHDNILKKRLDYEKEHGVKNFREALSKRDSLLNTTSIFVSNDGGQVQHGLPGIVKITDQKKGTEKYYRQPVGGHVKEEAVSTTETTLNESVDLAAKQKIIDDIAKHALSNEEQKLLDELVDKIAKLRKPKLKIAAKKTEKELNWSDAVEYVKTLGAGWRLPTKDELNQIYNSDNDFVKDYYWTSTKAGNLLSYAKDFKRGESIPNIVDDELFVRAVKD